MRAASLLAVLGMLLLAAPAPARVLPAAGPGEYVLAAALRGPDAAVLVDAGGLRLRLSSDAGRTFTDVWTAPDGEAVSAVGIDAGGVVWLTQRVGAQYGLRRVAGGTVGPPVPFPAGVGYGSQVAAVGGDRLIAVNDDAGLRLARVADDGTLTLLSALGDTASSPAFFRDINGDVVVGAGQSWRIAADGTPAADGGPYAPAVPAGRLLRGDQLYAPAAPGIWHPVDGLPGSPVPEPARVESTDAGLLLWGSGANPRLIESLDPPTSLGPLADDTRRMLAKADAMRAEQGLPALLGDPAASVASRNHARYNDQWGEFHAETPGRAGFTGTTADARCQAAGAVCDGSEILFAGLTLEDAVAGWFVTPYHRQIEGAPDDFVVAAASSARTAVMNGIARGLLTEPIGLPRGTWSGPLGFPSESPDPGVLCGLQAPYGTAVTAHPFLDLATDTQWTATTVTLYDDTAKAAVPGCPKGFFLPDDALKAGHVYTATATYSDGGGATRTHVWSFKTVAAGPDAPAGPGSGCVASIRFPRGVRRGGRLTVRVRACVSGTVRVSLRRRGTVRARRRAAAGSTVRVRVRVRRRVRAGRARLVVRLPGGGVLRGRVQVR